MKIHFVIICMLFFTNGFSQNILDRVEQNVKQRVNSKIDNSVNKGLDKVEEDVKKAGKKKDNSKNDKNTPTNTSTKSTDNHKTQPQSTQPETKKNVSDRQNGRTFSDFIPGTAEIFTDNFEKDAIGDFPARWNTNGSGKVVTIDGQEGKWLEIAHNSVVHPVLNKSLPENCTVEFDLFLMENGERLTPFIQFGLTPVKNILREDLFYQDKFYTTIWHYNDSNEKQIEYGFKNPVGNKNEFPLVSYSNKILHVSVAINKTRIRIYLDQTKLIDLPTALTTDMRNTFYFSNGSVVPASEIGMFIGNVRIATSETDARSLLVKDLLEKGKATTNEILFDVNKDIIKKESFSIINQIGEALKTNPSLKIKIIGHTDSDGAAANNLSLSKRRAEAVSSYLINNFQIEESRIITDGKGASVPVADNKTPEGKAKNRRVEFVKW